jgi:transitional endoplasmic reticulum ATPase
MTKHTKLPSRDRLIVSLIALLSLALSLRTVIAVLRDTRSYELLHASAQAWHALFFFASPSTSDYFTAIGPAILGITLAATLIRSTLGTTSTLKGLVLLVLCSIPLYGSLPKLVSLPAWLALCVIISLVSVIGTTFRNRTLQTYPAHLPLFAFAVFCAKAAQMGIQILPDTPGARLVFYATPLATLILWIGISWIQQKEKRAIRIETPGPNLSESTTLVAHIEQAPNPAQAAESAHLKQFDIRLPKYSFSEVRGMADLKAALLAAGESAQTGRDNGILLYGPPGGGKTFIAEALAGELNIKFLRLSIADIQTKWTGEKLQRVTEAFSQASRQAPCLLLLDEFDSLAMDRQLQINDLEAYRLTNALLTLIDAPPLGVLIIAATNRRDLLDEAAIRDGRFDFKIEVGLPDYAARLATLEEKYGKVTVIDYYDKDVILPFVARKCDGYSLKKIENIAKATALIYDPYADRCEGPPVCPADFLQGLRTVQGAPQLCDESAPALEALILDAGAAAQLHHLAEQLRYAWDLELDGAQLPRGILLYGPPGTGKSSVARAFAKESGYPFFATSGSALLGDPTAIDKLMHQAHAYRPSIVFIDEAHQLLMDRQWGAHLNNHGAVLNTLLEWMDGKPGTVGTDIFFIAAMNEIHLDKIDEAVTRGGRLSSHLRLGYPNAQHVTQFVQHWLRSKRCTLAEDEITEIAMHCDQSVALPTIRDAMQAELNASILRDERALTIEGVLSRLSASRGPPAHITCSETVAA